MAYRIPIAMKKILLLLSLAVSICAHAQIDSLSYAQGYQYMLGLLAGENHYIQSEEDAKEFVRGFEENKPSAELLKDSVFLINYVLGGMEAVFMSDSFEHTNEDRLPPIQCIIEGMRMVAKNEISLPYDTIQASRFLHSYPDSIDPIGLEDSLRCEFFRAYGIMKAYQPGLGEYIQATTGKEIEPNRAYYAQGFADILSFSVPFKDAYEFGRMMSRSMLMGEAKQPDNADAPDMLSADFLLGIKAALGLEESIISPDEIEEINTSFYNRQNSDTPTVTQYPINSDTEVNLTISPGELHDVDWDITAYEPVLANELTPEELEEISSLLSTMQSCGIAMKLFNESSQLIFELTDLGVDNLKAATKVVQANMELDRRGYSQLQIIGMPYIENRFIIAIVKTGQEFHGHVSHATVETIDERDWSYNQISFKFDSEGTDYIKQWADFTGNAIGKYIICELNGVIVSIPKVHNEITSGACAFSGISNMKINQLFNP